jgi:hypothetical protein
MNFSDTMKLARQNISRRKYPDRSNPRFRSGALFPEIKPKFSLGFESGSIVFTIGSCFARNIEEVLEKRNVRLPTNEFRAGPPEWLFRPNGLLNEYNPGTIAQRITHALEEIPFSNETIVGADDACLDLLLPIEGKAVARSRAITRRAEIDNVYKSLRAADVVIVTLGLIEAWFDIFTGSFLNRMPPNSDRNDERYRFRRLNVDECFQLLDKPLMNLNNLGIKTLLTISPVPLRATFANDDAIVANEYSKSVLRVCAEKLRDKYELIDYFPSYEIVRSIGVGAFGADNVHVTASLVELVTGAMVDAYASLKTQSADCSIRDMRKRTHGFVRLP